MSASPSVFQRCRLLAPALLQAAAASALAHGALLAATASETDTSGAWPFASWTEEIALNAAVLVLAWAACFRSLPATLFLPLLACAHFLSGTAAFAVVVHPFLSTHALYPSFLLNPATGLANPQSAIVLAFLVAAAAAVGRVLLPGGRSFDRMAVLAMAASVAVTGFMFHVTTVLSIELQRTREADVLQAVAFALPAPDACRRLRIECLPVAPGKVPLTGDLSLDAQASEVAGFAFQHPHGAFFHSWSGAAATDRGIGRNYVAALARPLPGDQAFLLVSFSAPGKRMSFEQDRFSLHAASAHMTWLLGAFIVCWMHSDRHRARRAMMAAGASVADRNRKG